MRDGRVLIIIVGCAACVAPLWQSMAQTTPSEGGPCNADSVVFTTCSANSETIAPKPVPLSRQQIHDQLEEDALRQGLARQRAGDARALNANDGQELEQIDVVGKRTDPPNVADVFEKAFGPPETANRSTTSTTAPDGSRTECVNHCVGLFCCASVPANPLAP